MNGNDQGIGENKQKIDFSTFAKSFAELEFTGTDPKKFFSGENLSSKELEETEREINQHKDPKGEEFFQKHQEWNMFDNMLTQYLSLSEPPNSGIAEKWLNFKNLKNIKNDPNANLNITVFLTNFKKYIGEKFHQKDRDKLWNWCIQQPLAATRVILAAHVVSKYFLLGLFQASAQIDEIADSYKPLAESIKATNASMYSATNSTMNGTTAEGILDAANASLYKGENFTNDLIENFTNSLLNEKATTNGVFSKIKDNLSPQERDTEVEETMGKAVLNVKSALYGFLNNNRDSKRDITLMTLYLLMNIINKTNLYDTINEKNKALIDLGAKDPVNQSKDVKRLSRESDKTRSYFDGTDGMLQAICMTPMYYGMKLAVGQLFQVILTKGIENERENRGADQPSVNMESPTSQGMLRGLSTLMESASSLFFITPFMHAINKLDVDSTQLVTNIVSRNFDILKVSHEKFKQYIYDNKELTEDKKSEYLKLAQIYIDYHEHYKAEMNKLLATRGTKGGASIDNFYFYVSKIFSPITSLGSTIYHRYFKEGEGVKEPNIKNIFQTLPEGVKESIAGKKWSEKPLPDDAIFMNPDTFLQELLNFQEMTKSSIKMNKIYATLGKAYAEKKMFNVVQDKAEIELECFKYKNNINNIIDKYNAPRGGFANNKQAFRLPNKNVVSFIEKYFSGDVSEGAINAFFEANKTRTSLKDEDLTILRDINKCRHELEREFYLKRTTEKNHKVNLENKEFYEALAREEKLKKYINDKKLIHNQYCEALEARGLKCPTQETTKGASTNNNIVDRLERTDKAIIAVETKIDALQDEIDNNKQLTSKTIESFNSDIEKLYKNWESLVAQRKILKLDIDAAREKLKTEFIKKEREKEEEKAKRQQPNKQSVNAATKRNASRSRDSVRSDTGFIPAQDGGSEIELMPNKDKKTGSSNSASDEENQNKKAGSSNSGNVRKGPGSIKTDPKILEGESESRFLNEMQKKNIQSDTPKNKKKKNIQSDTPKNKKKDISSLVNLAQGNKQQLN